MINGRKLAARGEKQIARLPFGQGRNDKLKWGVSTQVDNLQRVRGHAKDDAGLKPRIDCVCLARP